MSRFKLPTHASVAAATMCLFLGSARAEESQELLKPENGMYLLWSMGELMKSQDPSISPPKVIKDEWIYELVAGLVMNSSPVARLRLTVNLEIATFNVYPRKPQGGKGEGFQDTKFDTYIEEAKGVFTFGQKAPTRFTAEFGYFSNRYNSNARVFGEYLFRTMVYPSIIFNSFDYPFTYLSGVKVGHDIGTAFHHNLYFLTEFDHYPYFDFSVAYDASFNLANIVEVGAGANFQRLIPVRPSVTTPESPQNTYVKIPVQAPVLVRDSLGNVIDTVTVNSPEEGFLYSGNRFRQVNGIFLVDSNARFTNPQLIPGLQAEQTKYSFQGTIVMGRMALYPLGWMQDSPWKKGLSLYSELAVLGWKNYAGLYENRDERMPIMGGVQIARPGIIDVLAFEVEHFGSKNVASYYYRGHTNLPLPGGKENPTLPADVAEQDSRTRRDDWKFILYARKQFTGMALALQVGTDHMRRDIEDYDVRYDEILTNPSQWYWQLRIRIPY